MDADNPDCARSLCSADAIEQRRLMLNEPHITPLTAFTEKLRYAHPAWEFPNFDPLDGGVCADILFLFEKPGPMTSTAEKGSGFISQNNNDPTAEATFAFMREAGIPRKRAVIWNVVPGWNGTRKLTAAELHAGVKALGDLLPLLPKLRSIILVGQKAQRALALVTPLGLRVVVSAHPSPLVRASQPSKWRAIPLAWAQAK
jgi:uracil-DNA glycosylase